MVGRRSLAPLPHIPKVEVQDSRRRLFFLVMLSFRILSMARVRNASMPPFPVSGDPGTGDEADMVTSYLSWKEVEGNARRVFAEPHVAFLTFLLFFVFNDLHNTERNCTLSFLETNRTITGSEIEFYCLLLYTSTGDIQ